MQSLHPRLIGFLEGLCAASVTRYPEYGMNLRGPVFGVEVPARSPDAQSVSAERLAQFFLCALSDTSVERPREGEYARDRLESIIRECHPGAVVEYELSETRGWFDGLDIWLRQSDGDAHVYLDWSVS